MPRTAETVLRSIAWFPTPFPRDRERRIELLDRYAEARPTRKNPFDSLDEEFYQAAESENGGFIHSANAFANRGRGQ
jgi:hypothetical protein